jgi:uncharacterized protein (TIGR03083 family)
MPGIHSHQRCCDLASGEIARFAEVIAEADPATPVPTCGRWTLADLVQHIGHIHRWVAAMVAELSPTRHSRRKADLPLPPDPSTWPHWLADAQELLIQVLRAANPDAHMWAWGPDKHARFWSRRMLHETAVHRVDAELSLAIDPRIDPAVALDGISEFLENLPRSRPLRGNGETLHLVATDQVSAPDQPHRWAIVRHPTTFTWSHNQPPPDPPPPSTPATPTTAATPTTPPAPAVTARASSSDLYLFLWGRVPATDPRLTVTGDPALLAHWQHHAVIT